MTNRDSESRYAWLEDEVARGATIVTASRRLARDLAGVYGERRLAEGTLAWATPMIWAWPDWLLRLAAAARDPVQLPRQLDSLSVAVLWEQCLGRRVPAGVLSLGGVVRQAVRSWQRLGEWNVPVSALLATAGTEDERLFASAAADYTDMLQQNNWADATQLPGIVATLVAAEPDLAPGRLVLAGFDRVSPTVSLVIEALEQQSCVVHVKDRARRSRDVDIRAFADSDAEMRAAGDWARRKLALDPAAAIAIVSPELESDAEDVSRLVREGLVPGWQFGGASHRAAANLSYGRRLAEYPAISVALSVLRWTWQGLAGPDLSLLLRTACLGQAEVGGRSRIERAIRAFPDREWLPADFRSALNGADDAPDAVRFLELAKTIEDFAAEVADTQRAPTDWVRKTDELLDSVGWPGADTLDSPGYQLVNRWRELMNDFARVGTVVPSMHWREAASRIASIAAETVWQPDVGPGVVRVLGTLEAYGMEFDAVWVCGMDATQWPPPSRPLPFVSRRLQRDRDMPDATPTDTLAFARRLLERLTDAAPACVFSWSETRQDAELTPSPLLDTIAPTGESDAADPLWSARSLVGTRRLVSVDADEVPPVGDGERVRGGSYTLQRQFSEPFSAFVHGRLGVRPLDPFLKGLSPSLRGSVIHNALHNLLADDPSQAEIAAWPDKSRRIGSAVDAALDAVGRHADPVLQRLIGLEGRRLRRMLDDFIMAETERAAFAVAGVEKTVEYRRNGMTLGFRIDRVDQLPDGRILVIDYKTGMPKTFLTKDGDLTDLQLVAYADALAEPVGGLLFINVDSRGIAYRGVGDGWQASDDQDWEARLDAWRSELHAVVAGLAGGDARIRRYQNTADARPLAILSRFEELRRDR